MGDSALAHQAPLLAGESADGQLPPPYVEISAIADTHTRQRGRDLWGLGQLEKLWWRQKGSGH